MAKSQPQAAFSALTHGLQNKWTYLSRVTPDISQLLLPLDDALRTNLIPAVTGQPAPNDLECDLFALPARHGGLGIRVPSKVAERELLSSQKITSTLKDHILSQDSEYGYDIISDQQQEKSKTRQDNRKKDQDEADRVYTQLPDRLQKVVALSKEKAASTWLTALPLTEHGFMLHKSTFHDALALWYGWVPAHLPTKCGCGNGFSVEHTLSCAKGGFPTIRHNEIRDLTASLLTEVCNEICVEPELQPVTSDQLNEASANRDNGARLDVSANGVWSGRFQKPYLNVRVFNPLAPSNQNQAPATVFRKHELEKK